MAERQLDWELGDDRIVLRADGRAVYDDSLDHWENAVLRLLTIDDQLGRAWCEAAARELHAAAPREMSGADVLAGLGAAWREVKPAPVEDDRALLDRARAHDPALSVVWATSLPHDAGAAVVGPANHGRLVEASTGRCFDAPPMEYEEEYFEGGVDGLGYGAYEQQYDWRM
jgi:hypothetical protein